MDEHVPAVPTQTSTQIDGKAAGQQHHSDNPMRRDTRSSSVEIPVNQKQAQEPGYQTVEDERHEHHCVIQQTHLSRGMQMNQITNEVETVRQKTQPYTGQNCALPAQPSSCFQLPDEPP